MPRSTLVLPALIAVFTLAGLAGLSSPVHAGDEPNKPCLATKFETTQVGQACKEGGQKAAKALMKKVSDFTKAEGKEVKCKGCHTDMKTYSSTPETVTDLKRILAAMSAPAKPAAPAPQPPAAAPPAKQ